MLLQKALRELDGEIDRLSQIRAIVAGLHTTSLLTAYPSPAPQEAATPALPPILGGTSTAKRTATAKSRVATDKIPVTNESLARASVEKKSPLKLGKRGVVVEQAELAAEGEPVLATESVTAETAASEPRKSRRLRFERVTRTRRAALPEARALGGTIPAMPVFISSANAAPVIKRASEAARGMHKPAPVLAPEGTLDALLRELSYRPTQGA